MHDYPSQVKEKFDSILKNMAENHWLYTNDPGHAFMRQHLGKLSSYDKFCRPPIEATDLSFLLCRH